VRRGANLTSYTVLCWPRPQQNAQLEAQVRSLKEQLAKREALIRKALHRLEVRRRRSWRRCCRSTTACSLCCRRSWVRFAFAMQVIKGRKDQLQSDVLHQVDSVYQHMRSGHLGEYPGDDLLDLSFRSHAI